MDILGGAGICKGPMNFLASNYVATPVAITVEGSNILTRSLIVFGQGLNRSHPYLLDTITSIETNNKDNFHKNFINIIKHTFTNLGNSLYYGIYLRFHRKNNIADYHELQLKRHVANFAFSANIALLMGGKIKTAEYISGRYADILSEIYMSYACLWYYKKHKDIQDIDKLLDYSINDYSYNIQKNIYGIAENIPLPLLGYLIKIVTYPLGRNYKGNKDKTITDVSNIITKPNKLRDLLTENVFISSYVEDRIHQIDKGVEICYESDKLKKQLKTDSNNVLIMKANKLRKKIIKVNEFTKKFH